ncbi:MAG TPA: NAD-dependent epimerase/dehydratase family protein [Terriglobales bacterium]|jgi:nucleoside-diphosphate-sugar epimerase|nr:NAD-dependent epimerase/dehydratase family protein [Terriglobales bacterium]
MNVLITGGTGNIGSRLVVPLVRRGDQVTIFDIRSNPHVDSPEFHKAKAVTGDLADRDTVLDLVRLQKIDSIFHLGAVLSASAEENPHEAWQANMTGMVNVLDAARLGGAKKVIFSSTIATFGRHATSPLIDDSPQWPNSLYGVTKVAGERLGVYYLERFGVDFRGLRLPAVIAPRGAGGGASAYCSASFEESILQGKYDFPVRPTTRAPMAYIADVVDALVALHDAPAENLTRRMYNITGIAPSADEIAKAILKQLPDVKIAYNPDPIKTSIVESWPQEVDDSRARKDWNWKSNWNLDRITGEIIKVLKG